MMPSMSELFPSKEAIKSGFNPFAQGSLLRESIFYGGEAAYHFQYKHLSQQKYLKDDNWLIDNKGFSIKHAIPLLSTIQKFQNNKINTTLLSLRKKTPSEWTFIDAFTFTLNDIVTESALDKKTVKAFIESFISPTNQSQFNSLDDFNPINAYPIIKLANEKYLLFLNYSLLEALYETPFYWFNSDDSYKNIAMQHRGEFTEEFSSQRLKSVFGENQVFQNLTLFDYKNNKLGEIDVLVVFAKRIIILQAKSKKLTLLSRKGNDLSLQTDFKKAVQDAYDQAISCANFLQSKSKLKDINGQEVIINRDIVEIYPFCVVSDHYPALFFQTKQFLKQKPTKEIKPAFVMDVFFLDVLTEMLDSPLQFLSYVNRRTQYDQNLLSTHELTLLSYHLKRNLWLDNDIDIMQFHDDICADLDLAMMARRDDLPGKKNPEGILTKFDGTYFGDFIKNIESINNSSIVDLGFMLLTLSSETIEIINDGVSNLIKLYQVSNNHHDLSILIDEDESLGLTIHCNNDNIHVAKQRLETHCELRKYKQKSNKWFGICIDPITKKNKIWN